MKLRVFILILLLWNGQKIIAQEEDGVYSCARLKSLKNFQKTTVLSPLEDDYDLTHVLLDIEASVDTTHINALVKTTAKVVSSDFATYAFELNPDLKIDSLKVNGQLLPWNTQGFLRTVNLPSTLPKGSFFTSEVFYHGHQIPENNLFQDETRGIISKQDNTWNIRSTFTQNEPYDAKYWWPCKQSLRDKIDSADIWITVADTLKAGSNGRLVNVANLSGNRKRYEWTTNYPTDYYLLFFAVSNYTDYAFKVNIDGLQDSLLVQNFIYNRPHFLDSNQADIDFTADLLQHYSRLLIPYPFHEEKYGHCIVPLG